MAQKRWLYNFVYTVGISGIVASLYPMAIGANYNYFGESYGYNDGYKVSVCAAIFIIFISFVLISFNREQMLTRDLIITFFLFLLLGAMPYIALFYWMA